MLHIVDHVAVVHLVIFVSSTYCCERAVVLTRRPSANQFAMMKHVFGTITKGVEYIKRLQPIGPAGRTLGIPGNSRLSMYDNCWSLAFMEVNVVTRPNMIVEYPTKPHFTLFPLR